MPLREGGSQGGREEGKDKRGRERKNTLTTQGQILKWAALWFRVRP